MLNVSAAGALYACHNWASRLWFFIMAPPIYMMLWCIVGAIVCVPVAIFEGFSNHPVSNAVFVTITTVVTLGIYFLNCRMLRADGKSGLRMITGAGPHGNGVYSMPESATRKRFELGDC